MAHRGSDRDGYMQRRVVVLRIGRICHGKPVCIFTDLLFVNELVHAPRSCHLGNIIEYDTVTNLSWAVDVRTHAIAQIVDKILSQPWAAAEELGLEVPPIKRQDDCVVRFRSSKHGVLPLNRKLCRTVSSGTLETTPCDIST